MRSFLEDAPDLAALKLFTLILGAGFLAGGILKAALSASGADPRGLAMAALGAYVTAASLVGLNRGPEGGEAFAPACVAALAAVVVLAAAGGLLV